MKLTNNMAMSFIITPLVYIVVILFMSSTALAIQLQDIDLAKDSPLYDGMRGTLYVVAFAAVALATGLIWLLKDIAKRHKQELEYREKIIERLMNEGR